MTPPPSAKAVARAVQQAFGGRAQVHPFHDDDERTTVALLSSADAPGPGWTSHSTVDLHLAPNHLDGKDVRVELAGVCGSEVDGFDNMIATAAFYVLKDGWLAAPGVVFEGIARQYALSAQLDHVVWVPPFPWEALHGVDVEPDLRVHWLLAVPISESERRFLLDRGFDEFESVFAAREVEYFDLGRAPIL